MASFATPPDSLRPAAPFVQRAKEMERADEVIAYWCLYHAAQTAMATRPTAPDAREYLMKLLDQLESLKSKLSGNDAVSDDVASTAYVENFALKVFEGADNEDRAGRASRSTAMRFLAASSFIEVLSSVSPSGLEPEMASKLKYAKWKASDISKALRAGIKPTPGPPGTEVNPDGTDAAGVEALQAPGLEPVSEVEANAAIESALAEPDEDTQAAASAPSLPPPQPLPPPPVPETGAAAAFPSSVFPSAPQLPSDPTPPAFPSAPSHLARPSPPSGPKAPQPQMAASVLAPPRPAPVLYDPTEPNVSGSGLDPSRIAEIQKHAKWAISALNYDDVETARKELRLALQKLG